MESERLQILVHGQVQGVGFRPHTFQIAHQLNLTGWVKNTAAGVCIEVQGPLSSQFIKNLSQHLPPLAKINDIQTKKIPLNVNETEFKIFKSETGEIRTCISPDTSICEACLDELSDPKSRYFHYPFLNCTHCGPRLTITRQLPYDRGHTSMDKFPMCADCEKEYFDPNNRRYHAEPTACENCGPRLTLSILDISKRIFQGEIIALKGLGGYQLICDARNEETILKLRARKNREAKPFALMLADVVNAKSIVELSDQEEALLKSRERPIVLLRKIDASLPEAIAPGLSELGIMLPSTPLHYLLFNALGESAKTALIVTSANPGGDPLLIDDQKATQELSAIADKIISYNREIVTRVDDSVLRVINHAPLFIRRARGYVPTPIKLPHFIPPTLAVGGHLKNTFCITRGDEAFVSQHIGSLNNKATIEFFHESLDYLLKFLDVLPERIAHDCHPDFYTTRFAEDYGIPAFPIQHHHAHLASVAAEYQLEEAALGLALDGYGYGIEGESWGGELLLLEGTRFDRLGSLLPLPQPGGDAAAREPWRMAAAVLHLLGKKNEISSRFFGEPQAGNIHELLERKINTPLTSSCGRLFDAASALLGIRKISQYEGQAAMQLESLVTSPQILGGGFRIQDRYFDMTACLNVLSDLRDPVLGANIFHGTLIAGLCTWIKGIAREKEINKVLLSGGCFLNKVLAEGLIQELRESNIEPLLPRLLPPNDGGISLGQAWIAGRL